MIKVERNPDIPGSHLAVFDDTEIRDKNQGRPLIIAVDQMQAYFEKQGELRLYNYFEAVVDLVSLMCLQRNYKGINLLEVVYTLDFATDCFLNTNISFKMRANLAKVLVSLHIDKDPLETLNVPILTRVWQEVVQ